MKLWFRCQARNWESWILILVLLWHHYMMVVVPPNTQGLGFKIFSFAFWIVQFMLLRRIPDTNFYETELVKGVERKNNWVYACIFSQYFSHLKNKFSLSSWMGDMDGTKAEDEKLTICIWNEKLSFQQFESSAPDTGVLKLEVHKEVLRRKFVRNHGAVKI